MVILPKLARTGTTCRINRLKKKEEEKKKKAELEAAKKATQMVVYNASKKEEDLPRKIKIVHTERTI